MANAGSVEHSVDLLLSLQLVDAPTDVPNPNTLAVDPPPVVSSSPRSSPPASPPPPSAMEVAPPTSTSTSLPAAPTLQRVASHNSQEAVAAVERFESDERIARELWAADRQHDEQQQQQQQRR
jgi:hypothetical protein